MSTVTTEKSKTTSRKAKVLHDYAIEGVNRKTTGSPSTIR